MNNGLNPADVKKAIDLSKMMRVEILTGEDPVEFAKKFEAHIRNGWQDKGMSQNITWSEKQSKFVFGFCATFFKQGIT